MITAVDAPLSAQEFRHEERGGEPGDGHPQRLLPACARTEQVA